jgi:hypothetical protein
VPGTRLARSNSSSPRAQPEGARALDKLMDLIEKLVYSDAQPSKPAVSSTAEGIGAKRSASQNSCTRDLLKRRKAPVRRSATGGMLIFSPEKRARVFSPSPGVNRPERFITVVMTHVHGAEIERRTLSSPRPKVDLPKTEFSGVVGIANPTSASRRTFSDLSGASPCRTPQ